MIEVFIDLVLIIAIVVFWYTQYKFHWKQNLPTPCVVENQSFTDPYGNIYTCDRNLQPVYNNYQPAQNYDGELSYFNLETHTISPYKPLDGYFEYKKEGLEPLYFKKNIVFPFTEVDGKIIIKNSCYGKEDNKRVLLNPGELGIIDNTKGTPYGICKNGKVLQVKYCDKYQDFINEKCVDINPCIYRYDGYILDVGNNGYRYCKDDEIHTVECSSKETLINYQCISTPCKNAQDGFIISFDPDANTYNYCKSGIVQIHLCEVNTRSSSHGCINAMCIKEDGPNPIFNEGMYMPYYAECKGGELVDYVSNDQKDLLLLNAFNWGGGYIGYTPYLKYPGGIYTPDGWKSYIDPEYMPKDGIYATFELTYDDTFSYRTKYPKIYNNIYLRVHFKLNGSKKVEATIYNNLYIPHDEELVSMTRDLETPATVYHKIADLGYEMIITDEKNYVDLKTKPYYVQTCPDDYYVRFDSINPCMYKKDIISTSAFIPYAKNPVMIWETNKVDDLRLSQRYMRLGHIPPNYPLLNAGEAVRYYDYILQPNDAIQKISPFCGEDILNKKYFNDDVPSDDWLGIIRVLLSHLGNDTKFEEFYDMSFDPDFQKENVVGMVSVSSINNELFLYNADFQALWIECITGSKSIIKIDVSYIEYDAKSDEYPLGRYIAGYIVDEGLDITLTFRCEEPMYNYIYIYPKLVNDLLKADSDGEKNLCIPSETERFNIRVRRDDDYVIITTSGLNSHYCLDDLKLHFKMPICVYKGCINTLGFLGWDLDVRRFMHCVTGEYISSECQEDEILIFGSEGCRSSYEKFSNEWDVYLETHPYIEYKYLDIGAGLIMKFDTDKNYICGDKKTNVNSKDIDPNDMKSIIAFMLNNVDQTDFDDIYTISKDPDDGYIENFKYPYFTNFNLYSDDFKNAWYRALLYDEAIRIEITNPRYETVTLDGGYFKFLTFGEFIIDKIPKQLYFIDYDNDDTNKYIYLYPKNLQNKLNSLFGITCRSSAASFKIVDIFFEKLYLYENAGTETYDGPFSNPRIKNASIKRLELDNDGFLPMLAKYIRPKDARKND